LIVEFAQVNTHFQYNYNTNTIQIQYKYNTNTIQIQNKYKYKYNTNANTIQIQGPEKLFSFFNSRFEFTRPQNAAHPIHLTVFVAVWMIVLSIPMVLFQSIPGRDR
jgi:hypothetical protein